MHGDVDLDEIQEVHRQTCSSNFFFHEFYDHYVRDILQHVEFLGVRRTGGCSIRRRCCEDLQCDVQAETIPFPPPQRTRNP